MRAARLISLVLLLQSRGTLTGGQLAAELGVSERTIARDVTELAEAGIPVYARQGRVGGYRLVDGFRTRLTGLDRAEVEALFLSGAPEALRGLGLDDAGAAARLKVAAAISPAARDAPQRVRRRFHLDAPRWFQELPAPPLLPVLSRAVWADEVVSVVYRRGRRLVEVDQSRPLGVQRRLEPYGLVLKAGVWYLVARCEADFRVYRVDRVEAAEAVGVGFDRDEGFDLPRFWAQRAEEFHRSMLRELVTVRLSARGLARLPAVIDAGVAAEAIESARSDVDGWSVVRVRSESLEVAFEEMLRLGAEVEVLKPPRLRRRLADTAARLHERYRSG
jgi:predicted DNA-binding transcriptional regulator YafY